MSHTLVRSVDQDDRDLLREILQDNLMATQSTSIFGFGGLAELLDDETVEAVVSNCQFNFSSDYILEMFPVFSHKLASEILVATNDVFGDLEELARVSEEFVECAKSDPLMVEVDDWCTGCDSDSGSWFSQGLESD